MPPQPGRHRVSNYKLTPPPSLDTHDGDLWLHQVLIFVHGLDEDDQIQALLTSLTPEGFQQVAARVQLESATPSAIYAFLAIATAIILQLINKYKIVMHDTKCRTMN